jgi:hypothetical protein
MTSQEFEQELEAAAQEIAVPPCPIEQRILQDAVSGFSRHQVSANALPPGEQAKLNNIARLVVASFGHGCRPVRKIHLIGHADRDLQGGVPLERKVSENRAVQIQKALAHAIDAENRKLRRTGTARPLSSRILWRRRHAGANQRVVKNPQTEQERARNRRVQIVLVFDRYPSPLSRETEQSEYRPFPTPATPAIYPSPGGFAKFWADLISFRPPVSIQNAVNGRFGVPLIKPKVLHFIEDAYGQINLDYYPVYISRLPMIPPVSGRPATASEFLAYMRINLNSFVDTGKAGFSPYDPTIDGPRWSSLAPDGAVIHIDMRLGSQWANPDDGSVVCSASSPSDWTFSTLWTPGDLAHPVSGNRQFGYSSRPGSAGYIFYTRGADRATGALDYVGSNIVFQAGHQLWLSFQSKIESYVNSNGGAASHVNPTSSRSDWEAVKRVYFSPTVARV